MPFTSTHVHSASWTPLRLRAQPAKLLLPFCGRPVLVHPLNPPRLSSPPGKGSPVLSPCSLCPLLRRLCRVHALAHVLLKATFFCALDSSPLLPSVSRPCTHSPSVDGRTEPHGAASYLSLSSPTQGAHGLRRSRGAWPSTKPPISIRINQSKIAFLLRNAFCDRTVGITSWVGGWVAECAGIPTSVERGPPNCSHSPLGQLYSHSPSPTTPSDL